MEVPRKLRLLTPMPCNSFQSTSFKLAQRVCWGLSIAVSMPGLGCCDISHVRPDVAGHSLTSQFLRMTKGNGNK